MTSENLERTCLSRFGDNVGKKLYSSMEKIRNKDFCVATAWEANQVSIAISCYVRGKIFQLVPDYDSLIFPDKEIKILDISYSDISKYLPPPSNRSHIKHCQFDQDKIKKT